MAAPRRTSRTLGLARIAGAAAALSFAVGTAHADPPPFLPPSLQKVVEDARKAQQPTARVEEPSDDLMAVVAGDLTLGDIVEQLGDEDLATRERATEVLADVAVWDERVLAQVCQRADLCEESRLRVLEAMYTRFANSPRPAVGISMGAGEFGIQITEVRPPFPARRVLRQGDVIEMIGGVDFRADPRNLVKLQVTIASYDPGDVVDMLILRDKEEMTVQVELGNFEDLQGQAAPRTETLLRAAFEMRAHRLGLGDPHSAPIVAPVSRFDWDRSSRAPQRAVDPGAVMAGGQASLIPGRPTGGIGGADAVRLARLERARDDFKQANNNGAQNVNPVDRAIMEKIDEIDGQIASVRSKINDPRTTEAERSQLTEQMVELSRLRQILVLRAVDRLDGR